MCSANTVTMACMVSFSQRTEHDPSVLVSQKHVLAVCKPAPLRCMMMHVTTTPTTRESHTTTPCFTHTSNYLPTYLNGLFAVWICLSTCSMMFDVHVGTLFDVYMWLAN